MASSLFARAAADRISSDPELLASFHEHYTGEHDPLDALWWMSHPLELGPSGRPSPLAELKSLERVVFGREAPDRAEAEQRFRQLRVAVASETAATRSAVEMTLNSTPMLDADTDTDDDDDDDQSTTTEITLEPLDAPPARRSRVAMVVLVAAVSILIGVAGGLSLGSRTNPSLVDATGAVSVFDGPQTVADLPAVALKAPGLDVLSFRSVLDSPPVYAARSIDGHSICLVLVQPTGQSTANCAAIDAFPQSGLNLTGTYQAPGTLQPQTPTDGVFKPVDVTWLPDGNVLSKETDSFSFVTTQ